MGATNHSLSFRWSPATSLSALVGDAHRRALWLDRGAPGRSLDVSPGIGSRLEGGRAPASGASDSRRALAPARSSFPPKDTGSCAVKERTRTSSRFLLLPAFVMREDPGFVMGVSTRAACGATRAIGRALNLASEDLISMGRAVFTHLLAGDRAGALGLMASAVRSGYRPIRFVRDPHLQGLRDEPESQPILSARKGESIRMGEVADLSTTRPSHDNKYAPGGHRTNWASTMVGRAPPRAPTSATVSNETAPQWCSPLSPARPAPTNSRLRTPPSPLSSAAPAASRVGPSRPVVSSAFKPAGPFRSPTATPKRAAVRFRAHLPEGMGARPRLPSIGGLP